MKNIKIVLVFVILIITIFTLSSCSESNSLKLIYEVDNDVLFIEVSSNELIHDYKDTSLPDFMKIVDVDNGKTRVVIDVTSYTGENNDAFMNSVKTSLSALMPQYAYIIEDLYFDIDLKFYGTSIAGTTYYEVEISGKHGGSIPLSLISKTPFMYNGSSSVKKDDLYSLETNLDINAGSQIINLQSSLMNFDSVSINIDISTSAPHVEYTITHNIKDLDALKREIKAFGCSVDFCDDIKVVFSDKYNNVDDFANVFPMRNFSMLGIVTTAEMKYGSFFSDHCDVTLTFIPPEHDIDVYLKLTSQDNTEFIITTNEQQKSNSNTCSVDITEKTIVNAEYDNVKMFESITSILAIIAIMAVVLVMIYIAKRK